MRRVALYLAARFCAAMERRHWARFQRSDGRASSRALGLALVWAARSAKFSARIGGRA